MDNMYWYMDNMYQFTDNCVDISMDNIYWYAQCIQKYKDWLFSKWTASVIYMKSTELFHEWLTNTQQPLKKLHYTRITYTCFAVRTIFSLNIFCEKMPLIL